ncbi:MAG TPA: HRDC domain-containing protein, partial [Rhizomicrobium sp.]
ADRKTRATPDAAPLGDGGSSLLAALKELRLRLAKQRQVPAFAIFPDRTLLDMVQRRPQSEDDFAEVNGVGAKKLKEFGALFLRVIREA